MNFEKKKDMVKPLLLKNTLSIILLALFSLITIGIFTLVTSFMIKKGLLWEGLFPLLLILMFLATVVVYRVFGLLGLFATVIISWTLFYVLDLMFGNGSALLNALADLSIAPGILFIVITFMGLFLYLTFSLQYLTKFGEKITMRTLLGKKVFAWNDVKASIAKQEADGSCLLETTLNNDKSIYSKMTKAQMQHFVELCDDQYLSYDENSDDRPMLWKITNSQVQRFFELLNSDDFYIGERTEEKLDLLTFIKFLEVFGLKHFSYDDDNEFELYDLEYYNPDEDGKDKLAFFAFSAFIEDFDYENFSYDEECGDDLVFFVFIPNKEALHKLLELEEEYEDEFEHLEVQTSNKIAEIVKMFLAFLGAIYGYSLYAGILGALFGYFISFMVATLTLDTIFSLLDKEKG